MELVTCPLKTVKYSEWTYLLHSYSCKKERVKEGKKERRKGRKEYKRKYYILLAVRMDIVVF